MTCKDDDIQLARRIADGDSQSFGSIVERYGDLVFALVMRIAADRNDAEEIVQETFVKAYTALPRFDGRSSLGTWLCRIACNTAVSAMRRRRPAPAFDERRAAAVTDEEADALFGGGVDESLITALNRAIAMLQPDERALVTLFYYDDRPMSECASILGCTESAAKVRLHRIRKKLYVMIKSEYDEQQ